MSAAVRNEKWPDSSSIRGGRAPKFLVIRRDNIGDLVCTTPLLQALRARYPSARLVALVTSYNSPVIDRHPALDVVYRYTKLKHRTAGASVMSLLAQRLRMLWRLRRERFDYVIVAGTVFQPRIARLARWLRVKRAVGYVEPNDSRSRLIDIGIPRSSEPLHQVEAVFRLLQPLGIDGLPPPAQVFPDPSEVDAARQRLRAHGYGAGTRVVGVHLSTRKPSNRWPDDKYIDLIRRLHSIYDAVFLLLWAPGDAANPRHPGDDASAAAIKSALPGVPVVAYAMGPLSQLIADLSLCDSVITSDGGAMHIAAGLGKPILCFFGDTDATHWRPWVVPHVLLQPPSRRAADIGVDEAVTGFQHLMNTVGSATTKRRDSNGMGCA